MISDPSGRQVRHRVVFGPDGGPFHVGREQRLVSGSLHRAVELRDGRCVFAGCDALSHWADVHHLVHWIDGGETSVENSALLCERHYTEVQHGFRVERRPTGRSATSAATSSRTSPVCRSLEHTIEAHRPAMRQTTRIPSSGAVHRSTPCLARRCTQVGRWRP
jgi:hypothetical protein